MRIILVLLTIFSLSSCGFTPVYQASGESSLKTELSSVKIGEIAGRNGQILRTTLEDQLASNPDNALYTLDITLEQEKTALAIQADNTITRHRMTVTAHYILTRISDNKVMKDSHITRRGGFDRVSSEYATYLAEKKTLERLHRDMANDLRISLSFFLADEEQQ